MIGPHERLRSADSFAELAGVARDAQLHALLELPMPALLERMKGARGWVIDEVRAIAAHHDQETLGGFFASADETLRGSPMRIVRRVLLTAARDLIAGSISPSSPSSPSAPKFERKLEPLDPIAAFRRAWSPDQPADPTALREYAKAQGVTGALEKRVYAALAGRNSKLFSGTINSNVENSKLIDLLTRELWIDPRTRTPHPKIFEFRRAAWSYLDEEIKKAKLALEDERELLGRPLPSDPVVRAVVENLHRRRAELREHFAPARHDAFSNYRAMLIDQAPPIMRLEELGSSSGAPLMVELTLPSKPEMHALGRCTCPTQGRCEHILLLVDFALAVLTSDVEEPFRKHVLEVLRVPDWKRALALIDKHDGSAALEQNEAQVLWMIAREQDELELRPLLQERGKRGLLKPKKISVERLRADYDRHLLPVDAELAELLEIYEVASKYGSSDQSAVLARAFRKLIGHPRVVLSPDGEPITVEEDKLEMVALAEQGRIQIQPSLRGVTMKPRELLARFISSGIGDMLIDIDEVARRCALVTVPPRFVSLLSTLDRFDVHIPVEERDALVARLPLFEAHAPVRFEGDMKRVEVPGERQIVLRMEPGLGACALAVQIFVRPISFGPLLVPGTGASEVVAATSGRDLVFARRDLESEIEWVGERLSELVPGFTAVGRSWSLVIDDRERALDMIAALRSVKDVIVEWPHGQAWTVAGRAGANQLRLQVQDRGDWFGISGGIDFNGRRITLAVLLDAIRGKQRYVELDSGAWVEIDSVLRARLKDVEPVLYSGRSGRSEGSGAEAEATALAIPHIEELRADIAELETSASWRAYAERVAEASTFEPSLPVELAAELRPYQLDGYKWMSRLARCGAGACLADDMGLGKTLQTIALLLERKSGGPALVLAPTSVTHNWTRELERFAPGALRPLMYRGAARAALLESLAPGDVLIVSYGLLTRDIEALSKIEFHTLILDEAQAVKNAASHRAKAVRTIDARWRAALTGTPIENHLGELWAIFRAIAPGLLGSWEQFRARFAIPIERDRDPNVAKVLARSLRPFVLRRTKGEVARDLPPRTEIDVDVELSEKEREIYEDARIAAIAKLTDLENSIEVEQRRFHVLAAITRLRQLACHPRLVDEHLSIGSAKLDRLLELVRDLVEEGQRALVFSQFTKHLGLVREALARENIRYLYLDGSTPAESRPKIVDEFQNGDIPIFLISLKAGGTGLNLTGADNVIHLDPWWNPAVEDQATDRAHRIGQTRPVTVYRLIARGTIEDSILKMHGDKRALVAGVLDGSGSAAAISTAELMAMIRESAGLEPGEEDQADEVTAAPSEPVPNEPAPNERLKRRLEEYETSLWSELESGALREKTSVRLYLRIGRRLIAIAEELADPKFLEDSARVLAEYERRVEAGAYPKSDRAFLSTVVQRLCVS